MMGNTYRLEICGLVRELPIIRLNKKLSIASFVMLGDTELIEGAARAIVDHPGFPGDEIDILLCPEAKAIPLTHAIARILGLDYIVARKTEKAYMSNQIVQKSRSITTSGTQKLVLDGRDAETLHNRRIAIIDDVVSTGGSLKAVEALVARIDCRIVCKAAVLLEDAGYSDGTLVYLEKLPVFKDD